MRLTGKVAIVTGAGRGIGRAIAVGYAREGARVVVNYSRSRAAAEEAVQEIQTAGGKAVACHADVADLESHGPLIERVLRRGPGQRRHRNRDDQTPSAPA